MRVLASLSTVIVTTVILASCGLDMGGIGDVASTEGGPTLDSSGTAEGGSSSGGSGSSGGDGSTDGTMGPGDSSSGADSTAPPQDSSMAESGSPKDSSISDTYVADTYVVETGPPPCTTANGCYVIPSGWTLVPFAPSQSAACPTGFANAQPENLVELPITGGCACGACSKGTPPTCTGALGDYYDDPKAPFGGGQNCSQQGSPAQNNNSPAGQCGTDLYNGGTGFGQLSYQDLNLKYVPPTTVTGGTCTSGGTVSGTPTYAAQDRACTPDNAQSGGCSGNQCTPTFPSPYKVCIAMNGPQTCPGTFTTQHTVGASASYTCTNCGCTPTGTCQGGTMKLFTDNNCKNGELDIAADGACHASNAPRDSYGSYIYAANAPQVTCQSTGTSSPQGPSLQSEQTICCVP